MNWFSKLFRCRKLDIVPSDYTHKEPSASEDYNLYWKIDDSGVYLWHSINHYWQEMRYVNVNKLLKNLEEQK